MMILAMIGFSIAVIAICTGLLVFMMGGLKFPDEGRSKP
ncbi:hypothetical protein SAMN05414137_104308 [Streptacidiphilus jiangxiensis]|uniref:Uncharacterized protein n=1 Tax=Streptacidiphilus jiangxiensis TaxID=235985 RepID=A0A1H7L251_STRJI|nr:hypothetical protein SAMN05414137_104308 [Streptacidiphilus jiangxiensis]